MQRNAIYSHLEHVLAKFIKCKCCDGAVVQVSGAAKGYYGCHNARQRICSNTVMIPKNRVEAIVLNDLKEKFLTANDRLEVLEERRNENRLYYVSHTSIQALALLEEASKGPNGFN